MHPDPVTATRVKFGGVGVALTGFLLTRYTVAETVWETGDVGVFLVGKATFLVVGLGLTLFGVALAVDTNTKTYVDTVARWCALGTVSMGLLLGVTVVESALGDAPAVPNHLVSRILLGGAVGGVLTGVYAARSAAHRRELGRHADRLTVLNRILRHEVLNKVNVVEGYTTLDDDPAAALGPIRRSAAAIQRAMRTVGVLTVADDADSTVALRPLLAARVDAARENHPNATIRFVPPEPGVEVRAGARLGTAVDQLVDNAVVHGGGDDPAVTVACDVDETVARITVSDEGTGLPPEAEAVLTEPGIPRYDDPTVGFGLTIVRLVAEEYGARADVVTDGGETTVGLTLRRAGARARELGVGRDNLLAAGGASLAAGVVMGLVFQVLTGGLAIIGALYGAPVAAVGWSTHLFHSAVFGVTFAAAVGHPRLRCESVGRCAAYGTAFGVFLALFAAGVVMPLWLQLVGIGASVPTVSAIGLFAHVVWGVVLGGIYGLVRR